MNELGKTLVVRVLVVLGVLGISGCAAEAGSSEDEDAINAESTAAPITAAVPTKVTLKLAYWNKTCDLSSGSYCNWRMRFTAGTYKPSPYSCVSGIADFYNDTSSGVRETMQTKSVTDYFCPQTYTVEISNRTTGEKLPSKLSFSPSTCTTNPCTIVLNGGAPIDVP